MNCEIVYNIPMKLSNGHGYHVWFLEPKCPSELALPASKGSISHCNITFYLGSELSITCYCCSLNG
jgi:hypothetical protein